MNSQITKLFAVIVLLFGVLIYFTSRWTVFSATALNDNALNSRPLIAQLRIKRGEILADDGTVLAKSVKAGHGTWSRTYPEGSLFSQAVGYSEPAAGDAAGLEVSQAKYLRGSPSSIASLFGTASTSTQVGDNVHTTLDPAAQKTAREALDGQAGSVVALNPRTGAVLTMYSNPTYDDNHPSPDKECIAIGCLVNRAVSSAYPPGSTFKVVTATAAINTGKYTPDSIVNGNSPVTVSGVPLANDGNQSFGDITLTQALTQSVNTVWAPVAEHVGTKTMTEYMKRFGFYARPPLDYPPGEMLPSRVQSPGGEYYPPGSADEDIGRIGIGQGGLVVTPMQMAMVAAAVANNGKLMVPHLVVERHRARRPHGHDDRAAALSPGDDRQDRAGGQSDDAHGRRRGDRHAGPARRRDRVRRQDRDRVGRPGRVGADPAVVHRLRPRQRPEGRRRRRPRALDLGAIGRRGGGADRPGRRPDAPVGGEVVRYRLLDTRAAARRG